MRIEDLIAKEVVTALHELYGAKIDSATVGLQKTRKEFRGDYTVVTFPWLSHSRKSPEQTGTEIGNRLKERLKEIAEFNVIKGFLNLSLSREFWVDFLVGLMEEGPAQREIPPGKTIVIEYSSPNTNKPLHLGHIRNNLLGSALSAILARSGNRVVRVNLVNDRGVHICKSMLAWKKWGNGERPETSGIKGDHLVGKYYVLFDLHLRKEMASLKGQGMSDEQALKSAVLMQETQEMLRKWEEGDDEVRALWSMMNGWVYEGFDATYADLGIVFDKVYYESDTYLLGKALVEEGVSKGVLARKEDGSVWVDLRDDGLDEKLLIRADGTSVYITQDLGTADLRYRDFQPDKMIYVVGNEQNYHFEVLRLALKKLGLSWYECIYHFSYGMVELPQGKMKSREGTVVDADDLLGEMVRVAGETTEALGKGDTGSPEEQERLYRMLALGALKYFILKVDPKKNMMFNPEESIDFNGNTGPFIQYTHARIRSLVRKGAQAGFRKDAGDWCRQVPIGEKEINLLRHFYSYPSVVAEAGTSLSPALLANFLYDLARDYNHFYQLTPVLRAESDLQASFRLLLSDQAGEILRDGMSLLGIEVPEKM